jgi:mannonate dehydratase
MSNNRRDFIKKSASIATITSMGRIGSVLPSKKMHGYAKDAGMQLSEAYFRGVEQRRVDYCLQMNVLGAVSGVKTEGDMKPWDAKAIIANKEKPR